MDNQHKLIKGYRDFSPEEIGLMNEAKELQAQVMALHNRLSLKLGMDHSSVAEYERFVRAEPLRWLAIAKTDIQTGFMALICASAQPEV